MERSAAHFERQPMAAPGGVFALARQVRRLMCRLQGHDTLLHFKQRHVSLICTSCGYESPGWNGPGAPVAGAGETHRAAR